MIAPQAPEAPAATPSSDLVDVLLGAHAVALSFWDHDAFDIYECVKRSWWVRGMPIAYTAVMRAARHAVAGGDLSAINDAEGQTREAIAEVFARSAARILSENRAALSPSRAVHRRRGPVNGTDVPRRRAHEPVVAAAPPVGRGEQLDLFADLFGSLEVMSGVAS